MKELKILILIKADVPAERAKNAGMTMLSTEAVQGVYYWPAPGTFPGEPTGAAELAHPNTTEIVDGVRQVKDMLTPVKEAAERHGLRFGLYYASEGSNRIVDSRINNSSGFFMNVEDLVKRYDPDYLFFDGNPENKGNTDAMWSAVRAYNDCALIQANDQKEVSDNDLTILEGEYIGTMPYTYGGSWETNMLQQNKYTVEEVWSHPFIKEVDGWSIYASGHMRDDWRIWAEFIVNNIGHGFVPNYDQMIVSNRGVNWNGKDYNCGSPDVYYYYPLNAQRFIELRDNVNNWMANGDKPDLRESLFGTMPYYFDTYEKKAGYHENTENEPFLTAKYGEGPEWGYSVGRDQYVYMHMIQNTIGKDRAKKGFTGQEEIYAGPFDYAVEKVEWLNEGIELSYTTTQNNGKTYITINTSKVKTDPIDTVIKITTADPSREFQLTSVKLFSSQKKSDELQLRAEAYLKTFTNVFADADLTYTSDNAAVASVDQNGLVKAAAPGKTTIRVSAEYEGVTKTDDYAVQVKADGSISPDLELVGVVLRTDGKETFGTFSDERSLPITLEGRTQKGGGIDILNADEVKWRYGICSGLLDGEPDTADGYWHAREVEGLGIIEIIDNQVVFTGPVLEEQNIAIWADVTIDGTTYTTNMNYLYIFPETVLSEGIVPEVTSGNNAADLTDGVINSADGGNTSKWTPDKNDTNPAITLDLDNEYEITGVSVYYNNKHRYYNNTPSSINIEISSDGENWETAVTNGSVPSSGTKYSYEDDVYTYKISDKAEYVRLTFPGGAKNDVMDILEVTVKGYKALDSQAELEIEISARSVRSSLTGLSEKVL